MRLYQILSVCCCLSIVTVTIATVAGVTSDRVTMFSPGSVRRLLGLWDQAIASGLATQRRGIAAGARMVEEGKEARRYKEAQRSVSRILHHSHPYFIYEVIMKYI